MGRNGGRRLLTARPFRKLFWKEFIPSVPCHDLSLRFRARTRRSGKCEEKYNVVREIG